MVWILVWNFVGVVLVRREIEGFGRNNKTTRVKRIFPII